MPDAHAANEARDRVGVEYIADHAVRFALVEAALGPASDDTARILAAVLEERQALADLGRSVHAGVVEEQT